MDLASLWNHPRIIAAVVSLGCFSTPASLVAQNPVTELRIAPRTFVMRFSGDAVVEATLLPKAITQQISLVLANVPLGKALNAIAAQAGFTLIYDRAHVPVDQRVSIDVQNGTVGEALKQALRRQPLELLVSSTGQMALVPSDSRVVRVPSGGIAGVVRDSVTKKPLANVIVSLDGAKFSVRTNGDGAFHMTSVPVGKYALMVRRLGYAVSRHQVTVEENKRISLDVALTSSATTLEDVVTTMTGPQRRVELGHDVGVIKADSLVKQAPIMTISDLLMSRVPGLAVRQGQGTVGGDVKLQIRGPSSIRYSDEPIVIVDGIRYNSSPARSAVYSGLMRDGFAGREPVSPLNDLNPNDVETVEVIKGPSAATLYGPDAANGVIVITTKHGNAGPARWNVYGTRDYTTIPRDQLLTDVQYYGWGHWPDGEVVSCSIQDRLNQYCAFDSLVVKQGINSIASLSLFKPTYPWTMGANVSGGPQALRYFMGGSYQNAEGAISVPDTVRALLRTQGAVLPKDFLRPNGQTMLNLKANVSASAGAKTDLAIDGYYTRANTRSIDFNLGPINTLRADNINVDNGISPLTNSILNAFSGIAEEANNRFVVNGRALFRPISWLSGNGNIGIDQASRNKTQFQERDPTRGTFSLGRAYSGDHTTSIITGNGGVVASAQHGWLSTQTSLGVQYVRQTDDMLEVYGEDLIPGTRSVNFAANRFPNQAYIQSVSLGTFAEQRLGLNERLFVTAAMRADGSSAFGEHYRATAYPKFGVSWLVSQEPLFPRLPGVTEFRLRSAYGVAGRHPSSTDKLPTLRIQTNSAVCFNGTGVRCLTQTLGNPDLRPERSTEFEGGMDAGLFGTRAQLGLTWHHRKTRDLIINELLPTGMGSRLVNLGLATQHGFEMTLAGTVIATRPLSLNVSFNHSSYETKLEKLGDVQPTYSVNGGYVEGYPLGARFVQRYLGYEDKNGDGMLFNAFDPTLTEVFFGSADPDSMAYGGVPEPTRRQNLVLTFGLLSDRVRLSANVAREGGNTVAVPACQTCRAVVDSTASLAEQAFVARVNSVGLLTSATFTRLREVSASVTLPPRTLRLLRASSGSVALTARNLGLWTKTKMSDPESAAIGSGKPGAWGIGIPQARQWALRFDLGL